MNTIGFPNMDLYSDHEQGGEESFWPSFTDIMMVIVMTFLLITVAVILNNWQLVDNLKTSIAAERQAMAKAQSALQVVQAKAKENETLEERLARLETLLATRTQNLHQMQQQQQQTQLALETTQQTLKNAQATIQNLQQESQQRTQAFVALQQSLDQHKQQIVTLEKARKAAEAASQEAQQKLVSVNETLEKTGRELQTLRQKDIEGHERLVSLQGEYDALDKKYQKLLRPARSSKNKHVVRVAFLKRGANYSYQLTDEGQPTETLNRANLHKKLAGLKQKYGDELYVKIIIPESSSVSHAEAWKFTSEILKRYDYYHSTESSQ